MEERIVLVTGGTSGIGKAAATELARLGDRVIITFRDEAKAEKTLQEIRKITGSDKLEMMSLDLASLDSVRLLAKTFVARFDRLDVLINNAGGFFGYPMKTADGFEYTFGVNHLGHFLLTNLLKDLLTKSKARIINVSSSAHMAGRIDFDDIMMEKKYSPFKAYAQSKLANIAFSLELDRRWKESGIKVNAVHPGAVNTNFGSNSKPFFKSLMKIGAPFIRTPEQGADSLVYLASFAEAEGISGKYIVNRKEKKAYSQAREPEVGRKLWELSAELTASEKIV